MGEEMIQRIMRGFEEDGDKGLKRHAKISNVLYTDYNTMMPVISLLLYDFLKRYDSGEIKL